MDALRSSPGLQTIYQLHKNLRDDIENTADEFIANLNEQCEAQPLKLSVDREGKTYVMSVLQSGDRKTYTTRGK